MKWYVFRYNINKKNIEAFNIFEHYGFRDDLIGAIKEYDNKEEFLKYLKSSLMHFFWTKYEWEILICPYSSSIEDYECEKVDVYDQVMNNWDIFSEYVWKNKKELL